MTWQTLGELPMAGVMPSLGSVGAALTASATSTAGDLTAKIGGLTLSLGQMTLSPPSAISDIAGLTAYIASLTQTLAMMTAAALVSPPVPVAPAILVAAAQLLELKAKFAAISATVELAAQFSASLGASVTVSKFSGSGSELAAAGPPNGFGAGRCVAVALSVPEASARALQALFGGAL